MQTRTVLKFWMGLVIVAVAVGASIFYFTQSYQSDETGTVKIGDIVEAVYGLGSVTPRQSFQVKMGVTSRITRLYVREGDSVKKNQSLIELDQTVLFRSPFDGVVTSIPYKLDETVFPQLPILTVMNLQDRYIVVSLEQDSALRVKAGQKAQMTFETLHGQNYTGTIRTIFPNDSQFLVHIEIPNLPPEVIPGMTGDVAIEVARRTQVVLVPIAAVQSGRVFVRNGRFSKKIPVKIGAVDGRFAEITSDNLKDGQEILLPRR